MSIKVLECTYAMSVELFPSDMPLTSKVAVTILNETVIFTVWYFEYVLSHR